MNHQHPVEVSSQYSPDVFATHWPNIGPFVTACVLDAAPLTTYSERDLFAAATPLTLWAWQTAGMPLDRHAIFSVATIDRFIAVGLVNYSSNASRNTLRSRLLRISETLLTGTAVARSLRPLGGSDPTSPYKPTEIIALKSWALAQRSIERRRSAEILLALGLGAGLSGREIIETRITDIDVDDHGVVVSVRGLRPRRVPVLRDWERALAEAASTEVGAAWAFRKGQEGGNPNLITDFVSRSRGKIQLQARRMRTTWIVTHLEAGTPPLPLLTAAGVGSLQALDRFTRFLNPASSDTSRALLRDPGKLHED